MRSIYTVIITVLFVGTSYNSSAQFFPALKEELNVYSAGIYKEYDFSNSYLYTLSAAREYKFRTWWTIGGEVYLYRFGDKDYSSLGLSVRPVTRVIFYPGNKFQIFGEAKGGVIFMLPQYSHRSVNFTFVGSLGTDIYVSDKNAIRIAAGYNHFSNGKPDGDLLNPTWDGVGVSFGFVRTIK